MKIRKGEMRDLMAIVEFNQAMALETENLKLEESVLIQGVKGLLAHPERGFYMVAEIDGEIAGSLMVTFEWSDWRACQYYWIQSVYIRPQNRRQGIYAKMYQTIKEMAAEKGDAASFRLYVEQDNHHAQATYEALGMSKSYYIMYEEKVK